MTNYTDLIEEILKAGDEGVTVQHAERVAAKALFVMNAISEDLARSDKDSRMRKQGVKAIRSAVRQEEIKKHDKKPTEGALEDVVNLDSLVQSEETGFNEAEIQTEKLTREFNISKEAHLYFRSVAKGTFNG